MTQSGHRSGRNLASQQAAAPRVWVIMRGRRAFLFGSFPTADGRCRTGCCTPPHLLFAVSVFVSTGAATSPRAGRQYMENSKTIEGLIGSSLIELAVAVLLYLSSMYRV